MNLLTETFQDGDFAIEAKLEQGRFQYDVPDMEAALELARRFSATGRYKYFRGQKDATWRLTSTFERKSEMEKVQANNDLRDFAAFVARSPELLPYLQTEDAIIATAQHHGICPTTFLDFTTEPEVAAWFATHEVDSELAGCIYLIDEHAEEAINSLGRSIGTRILACNVANLWRLQAQRGLFLEATTSIDGFWPLDRIIFHHGGKKSSIEKHHIYPERKSHLELAIDQYKVQRERHQGFSAHLAKLDGTKAVAIQIVGTSPDEIEGLSALEVWAAGPDEKWTHIDVDSVAPEICIEDLSNEAIIQDIVERRRRCTDLLTLSPPPTGSLELLQSYINRFWEGCRPFPYTTIQLTRGLAATARAWQVIKDIRLSSGAEQANAAQQLLGDCIEIEMSTAGNNAARAFVSKDRLWSSLTEDARQRLGMKPASAKDIMYALQADYRTPAKNFDREAFVDLFIDQIIPWQVATKRNPVAYSPFLVLTLGMP